MNDDLFQFLFDQTASGPQSVTELNAAIRGVLEGNFSNVWVEGEVVGFTKAASGHWYFSLNDGESQIRCVCWKGTNYRIRFQPQNGITVRIRGRVTIYEARGEIQLSVDSLEPSGAGALAAAFEQIKARLENEGLFREELKRPLPFFPRRVAVVTSRSGAAFHDILTVLTRRARSVSILLAPAVVQGEGAADSIRRALTALNDYSRDSESKIDVVIVGRGGGSAEDLWAFNDESLARAIRQSDIPVISAVGHEIDWTIADMAADVRAATPSAAAEIVAAREEDILAGLRSSEDSMLSIMEYRILRSRVNLNDSANLLTTSFDRLVQDSSLRYSQTKQRLNLRTFVLMAAERRHRVLTVDQRITSAMERAARVAQEQLGVVAARLQTLSPLGVLSRGYSITKDNAGVVLRDASRVSPGDRLKIHLERGKLEAEVLSVEKG